MRLGLICAAVGLALAATTAQAATDKDKDAQHTGGTAKGAAVGALAGHEVGSGHAVAGAATGAAIGHHDKAKAEKEQGKQWRSVWTGRRPYCQPAIDRPIMAVLARMSARLTGRKSQTSTPTSNCRGRDFSRP